MSTVSPQPLVESIVNISIERADRLPKTSWPTPKNIHHQLLLSQFFVVRTVWGHLKAGKHFQVPQNSIFSRYVEEQFLLLFLLLQNMQIFSFIYLQ